MSGGMGSLFKHCDTLFLKNSQHGCLFFCGNVKILDEKWKSFHTLTDDNKCLHLESGEVIRLRPDDRIIFASPSIEGASPATISRLGVINLDAPRRNRL